MRPTLSRARLAARLIACAALSAACARCSSSAAPPSAPACTDDPASAPSDLRCTGLYAEGGTTLAPDVRPYAPGLVLWSDGADKSRFLYLPPGSTIDTTDPDEWVFPIGTKVWKEFALGGKRIETRLFWKQAASHWIATTYRWTDDGSRATRMDSGAKNVAGTYEIPDGTMCNDCHRGRKDKLLGVEAIALAHPSATGVTVATLAAEGRFTKPLPASLAIPEDATGNASAALGWMHINCGVSCHNRTGDAFGDETGLFLRVNVAELTSGKPLTSFDIYKTTVNVPISSNVYYKYPPQGYLRIKPGDAAHSLIPASSALRGSDGQMPPIATHVADPDAITALTTWINALP